MKNNAAELELKVMFGGLLWDRMWFATEDDRLETASRLHDSGYKVVLVIDGDDDDEIDLYHKTNDHSPGA